MHPPAPHLLSRPWPNRVAAAAPWVVKGQNWFRTTYIPYRIIPVSEPARRMAFRE
jgi:hypothetical protein